MNLLVKSCWYKSKHDDFLKILVHYLYLIKKLIHPFLLDFYINLK